jgi:hypothetical protein
MSALDDYHGRVQATVWSAAGWVSPEGLERVQHLVDHGEPAEGMCSLAWIIVNEKTMVPTSLIRAIRAYSVELVDPEYMPSNLDDFGLPEDLTCD